MISEILRDDNFREQITYKRYVSEEFSAAVGHVVITYESTSLWAVRMRHNKESVAVSSSDVQVGDVLFLLRGSDLPEGASLKDVIEDADGKVLGIQGIDPAFDLAAIVTVQAGS